MGSGAVTAAGGSVSDLADIIASLTREVADFPTAGVEFKDLTPLFADRRGLAAVTDALADVASGADLIAGIDARGFLIGGALATRLGTGVLAIRKGGKLPPPVRTEQYQLEYGAACLEIPAEGIELAGRSVVIVDDVLATGGTVSAAHRLLEEAGARVTMAAVVLELAALGGRERLAPLPVHSLRRI
jgi:adenine phosphoribosyltransferase